MPGEIEKKPRISPGIDAQGNHCIVTDQLALAVKTRCQPPYQWVEEKWHADDFLSQLDPVIAAG